MTATFMTQTSILLSGATAMTALLTTNCTPNSNQQETPTTATTKDSPYERRCIADASCDATQRRNATLDYLSAVYSNDQALKFDGVFTTVENGFATVTFGADLKSEQLAGLYPKAQARALRSAISPQQSSLCSQISLWHHLTATSPTLGEATAIAGVHHCINQFGIVFNASQVETKIAANPKDWVFFVEISPEMEHAKKQGQFVAKDEVALLYRIAERLKIPVENPIIPFNSEPVMKALEATGVSRMDQAVTWAIYHVLNEALAHPSRQQDLAALKKKSPDDQAKFIYSILNAYFTSKTAKHPVIDGTIKVYGLNAGRFIRACQDFIKPAAGEPVSVALGRVQRRMQTIMTQGMTLAEQETSRHIKAKLKQHGRKQALYQLGVTTAPILKKVYPGIKASPLPGSAPATPQAPKK